MKSNHSFIAFDNTKQGKLFDDSKHENYPINYYNIISGAGLDPKKDCSYYGYVYEGECYLMQPKETSLLVSNGMYFSVNGKFLLGMAGTDRYKAIIIEVQHSKGIYPLTKYRAMRTLGGKIEAKGRLKYIDGCTDSLLIPPVKKGDPCLNHLHFPAGIDQTSHTHPTHRIGIIASGSGICKTPFGNMELKPGMIFIIKAWDGSTYKKGIDGNTYPIGAHSFKTEGESMDVVAFHPDSDTGSTDIDHPMINRTIVNGTSASQLENIRTK